MKKIRLTEKYANVGEKLRLIHASKSAEEKFLFAEKMRVIQKKSWEVLPEAFVKNCLENDLWHEKLSKSHQKPCSEKRRIAIIESKSNLSYDEWLLVRTAYQAYVAEVRYVTNLQPIFKLKNYEIRGYQTYHLDHKFSVVEGFRQNIDPNIIGDLVNLEYIPAKENIKKSSRCSITLEQLMKSYNESRTTK